MQDDKTSNTPCLTRRRALSTMVASTAVAAGPKLFTPALAQGIKPFVIGVLNDQGGPFMALGGPGSVVGAKLGVEDYGGKVLGRPVQVIAADHQNKPDVGVAIAREWADNGVAAIADGGSSAVGMALQSLMHDKNLNFLDSGSVSSDLFGKGCAPTGIQWVTDTYTTAHASTQAFMKTNPTLKKWFTVVADYNSGYDLERTCLNVVKANGGEVAGAGRFPSGTSDFSSVLLQAQASGAQVLAVGVGGSDGAAIIKQFHEFGMEKSMALVGLAIFSTDLESLGHEAAQGLLWATNFYWDRDDASRAWTKRFRAGRDEIPTRVHASAYGIVIHYLRAVDAVGSVDGLKIAMQMRATKATDPLFKGSWIREDGRVMSPIYLMRNKTPAEARGPSDWAEVTTTLPAEEAYRPLSEGGCPYIKV